MITDGYFIGNRRLLSTQLFWRRWLVEFACWVAGWTCGDEIHGNTITFDLDRAIELSSRPGWFKIKVALDAPLPEDAVYVEGNDDQFPLSDKTHIYHRGELLTVKPCAQILAEQKGVEALTAQVDRIRDKLRTPVAL